jgi:aspartyl-tRNA synthetase
MLLTGRDSIRDVIAFPKAASGHDPLTGAPTPITPQQRKEAGIDVILPLDSGSPDATTPDATAPDATAPDAGPS